MGNSQRLESTSILRLLIQFSIPAFIGLLVNAIYNIVDRAFIGRIVGEQALAAITIGFPIMFVVFSGAVLIGGGGASLISLSFGEKDTEKANSIFTQSILIVLLLGIILSITGYLLLDFSLSLLTSDHQIILLAKQYLEVIYIGVIFQLMGFILTSIARAEGFPIVSMVSMLIAAVVNIILDYVFIARLGMGVQGAALATIIGQFLGFAVVAYHFWFGNSQLRFGRKYIKYEPEIIINIFKVGAPSFVITLGSGISMMILTSFLGRLGGTSSLAAMGAITSLTIFLTRPLMGLQNGIRPIIGYNYGAKNYSRVRSTIVMSNILAFAVNGIILMIVLLFPQFFLSLFIEEASETMAIAIRGMRIYTFMLPLIGINVLGAGYFQSIADSSKAFILGGLRQLFLLIPLLFILPEEFGILGVWYATPVADGLAILISMTLLIPEMRRLSNIQGHHHMTVA